MSGAPVVLENEKHNTAKHTEILLQFYKHITIQWRKCTLRVLLFFFSSYRLQEGLRLVKAIKLFVFHHQEMSSIDDYSLQADE